MTKVNLEALELLPVIEHLDFVITSYAVTATGEAKYELFRLLDTLDHNPTLAGKVGAAVAVLRAADAAFTKDNYPAAINELVKANELLWARIFSTTTEATGQ